MKQIIFIAVILFSTSVLYAQKDTGFYKHEVRLSVGDAMISWGWLRAPDGAKACYANLTASYFYRPVKWFWVGGNFINYFGEILHYDQVVYDFDGNITKNSKSKPKYCAVIAPALRFSYLNTKTITIYSTLSGGIGVEDGYDYRNQKFPVILFPYVHVTYFGISGNLGKNKNIFVGGESGIGYGSFVSVYGGYRF